MYLLILTRSTDIIFSIILITFLSPFIFFIAFSILIFDGYPIFYYSNRIGKNGSNFRLIKFRTMKNNNITNFGRYLRRSSIDEIPQLFNVLFGHMSIVGPRPIPIEIEKQLSEFQKNIRRSVYPGITGYCQINYRGNKRTWDEKIELDIYFINNKSFYLYILIILKTFRVLIIRFTKNKSGDTL